MAATAENALLVIAFGCRSGSYAALGFFGAIFGLLGLLCFLAIRRRHPTAHRAVAPSIALTVLLAPMSFVYASSLDGFYESEVSAESFRLHHLVPAAVTVVSSSQIASIDVVPTFKDRCRLRIVEKSGASHESANSRRDIVEDAARIFRSLLEIDRPTVR